MHLWGSVTRVRTASRKGGTQPTGPEHRGRGGEAETAERQAGQPWLGLRIPSTLGGVLASLPGACSLSRGLLSSLRQTSTSQWAVHPKGAVGKYVGEFLVGWAVARNTTCPAMSGPTQQKLFCFLLNFQKLYWVFNAGEKFACHHLSPEPHSFLPGNMKVFLGGHTFNVH